MIGHRASLPNWVSKFHAALIRLLGFYPATYGSLFTGVYIRQHSVGTIFRHGGTLRCVQKHSAIVHDAYIFMCGFTHALRGVDLMPMLITRGYNGVATIVRERRNLFCCRNFGSAFLRCLMWLTHEMGSAVPTSRYR